nr:COR domain-containing protein [uncultured Chryseobacterium sp.]
MDILQQSIYDVNADLRVIPISTEGTISNSFKNGLEKINLPFEFDDRNFQLGDIEIIPLKTTKIAFVCTVDNYKSEYYAIRLIGRRLANDIHKFGNVNTIALPLLGTGAGKLDPEKSINILGNAFYEIAGTAKIKLSFCTTDESLYQTLIGRNFNLKSPSSQLIIEAELSNVRIHQIIEKILYEKEFYHELAHKKFQQFLDFEMPSAFYQNLHDQFKFSHTTFQDFINTKLSPDTKEYKFTKLCGELVAYIDLNAYRKNLWNKYSDKRVIAKSAVRQNIWFLNLLKYKKTKKLSSVSSNIRNALNYLEDPEHNLTMLSENHRKMVYESIFPNIDYEDVYRGFLFDYFQRLGLKPNNPLNLGVLISRILYLPFIKPIWAETNFVKFSLNESINIDLSIAGEIIEECLRTKSLKLDLGNCGLTDLSVIPELFECTHIETLILSNEWAVYKENKWKDVKSLNKGKKNNIQFIPNDIVNLKELKNLICGGDWYSYDKDRWGIQKLGLLTSLQKLEYLNVSNNKLTNLSGLNKLQNLKIAHLNNNEITTVESLEKMTDLEELYLSNNKIENLDFLKGLKNIKTLDLHHNRIRDLTPVIEIIAKIGISNEKWVVNTFNISNNPLEQPPMQIVNLGKEDVLGHFKDIEKSGQYVNNEIKVILVGNSEVGKSTLLKYLDNKIGLEDEHPPTLWMEEKIIKSKYKIAELNEECFLHVFDFGGHDYFHDTHHLFYTSNTIYVLLWDQKTDVLELRKTIQKTFEGEDVEIETQDYPLKYWLDSVKFYIRNVEANNFESSIKREVSYNSSLLLLQNKVADASQIVFRNGIDLKEDYSFIYEMINVSIKNPSRNMIHFDNLLSEMLNNMEIIGAILPKFYAPIKQSIDIYKGSPILTFAEFLDHCNKVVEKPIDEEQCRRMMKYLQQIGVLLYSSRGLDENIYIDKRWIIDNIHKILKNLSKENGKFNRNYVVKVLGKDDKSVDDILVMMQDFKMIFKHPYSEYYIAPLYLPQTPSGKIGLFLDKKQKPWRRFEYKGYIHKSVILSIFQEFGSQIPVEKDHDNYYYWKDGLIVKSAVTNEIIMIKFHLGNQDGNACIDIYELNKSDKTIFRDQVREFIRSVNIGYDLEEMVTLDGEDYISKDILEKYAKIGKYVFSEKKLIDLKKLKQDEKLFKLKDFAEFIDSPVAKKKVVISYSKKDLVHVHTLRRYLQPLIDSDLIEQPWYCTFLNPGEDWNDKIKSNFDEADIIFFMISEYFYSTKYIVDHEITTTINRYNNGDKVKIIPIILEFYDWGRKGPYNLQRFSALPYQARPISGFNNEKLAWSTITSSLKMMIEKDLDPAKIDIIGRDLEEIYERLINGKLDKN